MKVKELIKKLKKEDPEKEVTIWGNIDDDGKGLIMIEGGKDIRNN